MSSGDLCGPEEPEVGMPGTVSRWPWPEAAKTALCKEPGVWVLCRPPAPRPRSPPGRTSCAAFACVEGRGCKVILVEGRSHCPADATPALPSALWARVCRRGALSSPPSSVS